MFGRLPELSHQRGEGYLFYSYNHISGAAVLAGLISGDAAKEFEERSLEQSTERVMAMIRGIFEPKGIIVPAPLQVRLFHSVDLSISLSVSIRPCTNEHLGLTYVTDSRSVSGEVLTNPDMVG